RHGWPGRFRFALAAWLYPRSRAEKDKSDDQDQSADAAAHAVCSRGWRSFQEVAARPARGGRANVTAAPGSAPGGRGARNQPRAPPGLYQITLRVQEALRCLLQPLG